MRNRYDPSFAKCEMPFNSSQGSTFYIDIDIFPTHGGSSQPSSLKCLPQGGSSQPSSLKCLPQGSSQVAARYTSQQALPRMLAEGWQQLAVAAQNAYCKVVVANGRCLECLVQGGSSQQVLPRMLTAGWQQLADGQIGCNHQHWQYRRWRCAPWVRENRVKNLRNTYVLHFAP